MTKMDEATTKDTGSNFSSHNMMTGSETKDTLLPTKDLEDKHKSKNELSKSCSRQYYMFERMLEFIQGNAAPRDASVDAYASVSTATVGASMSSSSLSTTTMNSITEAMAALSSPTAGLKLLMELPPDQRGPVSAGFFTAVASKNNAVAAISNAVAAISNSITAEHNAVTAKIVATYNDNQCDALESFNNLSSLPSTGKSAYRRRGRMCRLSAPTPVPVPLTTWSDLPDTTEEEEEEEKSNSSEHEGKDDDENFDNVNGRTAPTTTSKSLIVTEHDRDSFGQQLMKTQEGVLVDQCRKDSPEKATLVVAANDDNVGIKKNKIEEGIGTEPIRTVLTEVPMANEPTEGRGYAGLIDVSPTNVAVGGQPKVTAHTDPSRHRVDHADFSSSFALDSSPGNSNFLRCVVVQTMTIFEISLCRQDLHNRITSDLVMEYRNRAGALLRDTFAKGVSEETAKSFTLSIAELQFDFLKTVYSSP